MRADSESPLPVPPPAGGDADCSSAGTSALCLRVRSACPASSSLLPVHFTRRSSLRERHR